jgi:crossover junction endodeoxyribonuclease RuvC
MKILALDLGTNMGFAICGEGSSILSGVMNFKFDARYEGGGMRYVRFNKWLSEMESFNFDMVVFEEVRRHAGTTAAHVYGGFMACLTEWCETNSIPYSGVSVGAIKKFATGKGNANKDAMIEAARSWGYEPVDDNEADALAILHLTMTEHGEVIN